MHSRKHLGARLITGAIAVAMAGCAAETDSITTRLVLEFDPDGVANSVYVEPPERTLWRFDGEGTVTPPEELAATGGWTALNGVEDLAVRDNLLTGRISGEAPLIAVRRPDGFDDDDLLHSIEIRLKVSEGSNLGVAFSADEEIDLGPVLGQLTELGRPPLQTPLVPGDNFQTYILTSTAATFIASFRVADARHLMILPSDVEGAEFEIEYVRLVTRREELASVESGVGWHGLGEIYRETIVSRSPERVDLDLRLPREPLLDLTIGMIEAAPLTFTVSVRPGSAAAGDNETVVLRRTLTTPHRWESVPLDISAYGGGAVTLSLALQADQPGRIGFWGAPTVRSEGASPPVAASPARAALTSADAPRGVILIVADTLRRDHLDWYGYERPTAPVLAGLAQQGVRFDDNISPATWTKVAVPSILTSLHPRTHGITDLPDRMPSIAVTLEEVFQAAGYATFHTSSVPFTGKLTNLHQGAEVLHEFNSVPPADYPTSKTARTFMDRFLEWLEPRREVPFFAMIHAFDPHSPYRPYPPYDTEFATLEDIAAFEADVERAREHMESEFMKAEGLPDSEEMAAAGIERDTFLAGQYAWYDGSIRAMDAEIGRLMERLEGLGLADDTLIAFIADHGEEFQEHGRPWHGLNAYGYMINVPMMLWWPGALPAGTVVEEMTSSLDLMPTLIDLAGIEIPETLQGQSLVPLLADPAAPDSLGWERRPAFAERIIIPSEVVRGPNVSSLAIVDEGWKLIYNFEGLPQGWPEYELYDHAQDPLNLTNVAAAHADIVERLRLRLEEWREWAEAARISEDSLEGLDAEELQRLRALGYIR